MTDENRHAGLVEIRTIPAKKDIAFVEFADEATATVAKDALHNFKIDGETKMKASLFLHHRTRCLCYFSRSPMLENSCMRLRSTCQIMYTLQGIAITYSRGVITGL